MQTIKMAKNIFKKEGIIMALTAKELILVQDNISMTQNSIKFIQGCAEMSTDQQVKSLCQQMASDHQNDLQTLIKHINTATMQ
jgi:rubrerythrin